MTKIRTLIALGIPNLCRVAYYRFAIKLGLHPVLHVTGETAGDFFFRPPVDSEPIDAPVLGSWKTTGLLFGWYEIPIAESPPDWMRNYFNGKVIEAAQQPWWKIPDFETAVGDIKLVWEMSRMDWLAAMAQRVRNGDDAELHRLNLWLSDWCKLNPAYLGPNWKCGQEASLRVIRLAMAAIYLNQVNHPTDSLKSLLVTHLRRISPTMSYAIAQDNNHATSEAAALYIGGSWLRRLGVEEGAEWYQKGKQALERCATRLIDRDGGFSQYSVNYHRLMLDSLCLVEIWRRKHELDQFSCAYQARTQLAAKWLFHLVDEDSGGAPNLGANDGAWLLQFYGNDYRDFRSTVQLSSVLFSGKRAYPRQGNWDNALKWFDIPMPKDTSKEQANFLADANGLAVLARNKARAILRYPRFKFRPSQADALHLDFWMKGENILRDGGSYSYNTNPELIAYFSGTASHNTVQFDNRDQMPKLSRFLYADWIKTSWTSGLEVNVHQVAFGATCSDQCGAMHRRSVILSDNLLSVRDQISGFNNKAVLRWRLSPGDWSVNVGNTLVKISCNSPVPVGLTVESTVPIKRAELLEGMESRYYMQKSVLPVLEIEVEFACIFTTNMEWADAS